jgi:sugar transferase (PEP-CTERM system associated)
MWPLNVSTWVGRRMLFLASETLLLFGAIFAALSFMTWAVGGRAAGPGGQNLIIAAGLAALCQVAFYYAGLHGPAGTWPRLHVAERLFRALGVVALVTAIGLLGVPHLDANAPELLLALAFPLVVIPAGRDRYPAFIKMAGLARRVLVLGGGPDAEAAIAEIGNRPELGYHVVGSLTVDPGVEAWERRRDASLAGLPMLVERERVDVVMVAWEDRSATFPLDPLLACRSAGVTVINAARFYEQITGRVILDRLAPSTLIYNGVELQRTFAGTVKRALDVIVSAPLLVLLTPVLGVVALLVRWDSPGPVFYTQERVGVRGRPFTIRKIRSMTTDAEKTTGPVWAADGDLRVTRVGRFLRASRLDECPQVWNVLKGDMSLVGPRPERPVFVEHLSRALPYYAHRHLLKPGVTGWAQVCYPYGASVDDARAKLTYDLYYLLHWSIAFDLLILFHTIKIVLCRRGAR